jgi:nicotinamidase-related amidase
MKALLCLDFENDIIHPDGKVAGKGYSAFATRHGTISRVRTLQTQFRERGLPVVHVRVGFWPGYHEQPKGSPLLGRAHEYKAFDLSGWGTAFIDELAPVGTEVVITKHRVGSFWSTPLELTLRTMGVTEVVLAGVATDMVVESTAREAHDRDFGVSVVADCCVAATDADHERSIANMRKLARVVQFHDLRLP